MNNTKSRLKVMLSDIKNVLGTEELDDLEIALKKINDEFHDDTSAEEFALHGECELEICLAERLLADVYAAEKAEWRADELREREWEENKHFR
tara:strand:- start:5847 stop:6125 length:279 start_codon:yes stop_codon:yes gene_type:complete